MQTHVEKLEASKNTEIEAQVQTQVTRLRDVMQGRDETIRMMQTTETERLISIRPRRNGSLPTSSNATHVL